MDQDKTEFIFVRHGETEANIAGVLQGQLDTPLTDNGIAQAQAVGKALRHEVINAVYGSDLMRVKQTAEKIVSLHDGVIPVTYVPQLREWKCGEAEGLEIKVLKERYPEAFSGFSREKGLFRFPGGESRIEFQQRIDAFLDEIALKHRGERVLLISHGGTSHRVFHKIVGEVADNNFLPLVGNASISTFVYHFNADAWQMLSWNCREHLRDVAQHISKVL